MTSLRNLLELIRFSHTIFALPFALLAALMAWYARPATAFRPLDLVAIILCMVMARTVAMACNRIADRRIDALNPRTAQRHLPAGRLSLLSVVVFAAVCAVAFVASTALFLPANPLPVMMSLPVLLFLIGYSYAKRFTALAHFWLGAALMLAPVCAWIAIRGPVVLQDPSDLLPAVVLGAAVMLWVAGFDIIYACQDAAADVAAGLHSVPSRVGVSPALRIAMLCHVGTVLLLACLPLVFTELGWIYWCGIVGFSILLTYEHLIVRPDDLGRVNVAFFNVNAVISLGLLLVVAVDLLIK